MLRRVPACLLALFGLGLALLAADNKPARVFDPPKVPEDARLGKPVDLNNPASFKPAFGTKDEWERRAKELREQVLVANGLWPMPEKTPLNPVIHGKIDRDEYTVEKVFFASLPGHYVCGNLYRPKKTPRGNAKLPAVLCPHGHWNNGRFHENNEAGVKKELDSGAEKMAEGARYPLQARCAMLARMGCVVFHYDMVGYADSKKVPHREGFADADAELRLQSAMGLQTWNSIRALDFLCGLPEVDAGRVAVTGASGGGTQTFILCAVDPRPAVSFPAVMVSTGMQGGCICENCSLLRIGTNNIELAALFAPKPQAMTGADDWTREIETKGLPELKNIYGLYGGAERVSAKYYSFPHNYNQVSREMMYNWVNQHLQLGQPAPVVEKPFTPIPPKELSVFDDKHPRPSDEADAAGVRKWLTQSSDRQLAELAKNPDQYHGIVSAALRAMIQDRLPKNDEVTVSNFKEVKGDGFNVHQSTLSRAGAGEQIPTIGVVPPKWNGTIVVWVHPSGKASLFGENGKPVAAAQELLDKQYAILCGDLFLTGEFHLPDKATPAPWPPQPHHKDIPYAGYYYGYNRGVLANRTRDLLTVIAFARKAKTVHLVAFEDSGPGALLARALSGDAVSRAAIDLHGFDFDQVKEVNHAMMLPGALKYGGVYGFVPLCQSGETLLADARKTPHALADKTPGVSLQLQKGKPEEMVRWLMR